MNGLILVDKPCGKTSHDVVGAIRKIAKTRRVGHTGTLDPLATGVLPVCIGNATKACDMLIASDKHYRAELVLGMTTDTLDSEGEVLSECAVNLDEDRIRAAVMSFVGEQEQIPPMYSAIKKDGKKLYELAREGKTVEREPRKINIFSIDILEIDLEKPSVTIDVHCSKGTYIRTLCEDIGISLGVGAYMNTLCRTKSAGFDLEKCYTLAQITDIFNSGKENEIVIPTDSLFYNLKSVKLNEKQSARIKNGVFVSAPEIQEGEEYRVYDNTGNFLCIAECCDNRLRIKKSFWS